MNVLDRLRRLARRRVSPAHVGRGPDATFDSIVDPQQPIGIYVDVAVRPDPSSVFLVGWMWDPEHRIHRIRLVVDGQRCAELQPARYDRHDVLQMYGAMAPAQSGSSAVLPGLASFVPLDRPAAYDAPLRLELEWRDGRTWHVGVPQPSACPFATRAQLVAAFPNVSGMVPAMREFQQAMGRTLQRCTLERRVANQWTVDQPAARPEVSIVVPLFNATHLLESQLAEFARDQDLRQRSELLYVLDSPPETEWVERLSRQLAQIYRVPARFLALAHNAGFAGATNEGVRHARGDLILLLNSDVMPTAPGWIGRLLDAWRALQNPGALAPKLLFEDGSLQHAGLYWAPEFVRLGNRPPRPIDAELWTNQLYYKGLPGDLPQANVAREVPALSAACLLTSGRTYAELGGFDESYVQGDCEDSDFCLRLAARGLQLRYEPAVTLYHLEAQSYPPDLRQQTGTFNVWQQDQRWREAMIARMRSFPPATS